MMFGGQQATGFHVCAPVRLARMQRVDVEELRAVERDARQETVVERALDQVGEAALAGDQKQAPVPHHARDRRARLAVRAIGRQLVRIADRLAGVARSDAAGQVHLRRGHVLPLGQRRGQQLAVAGLGVDVGDAGGEVERAHGVPDDRARAAHRLAVLVVVGREAAPRTARTAPRDQRRPRARGSAARRSGDRARRARSRPRGDRRCQSCGPAGTRRRPGPRSAGRRGGEMRRPALDRARSPAWIRWPPQ